MQTLQQILSTLTALVMALSAQIASLPPSSQLAQVSGGGGITFDASSSAQDVASSLTWPHTIAPGGVLFVSFSCFSGGTPTSVTYNGVAMTQLWNTDLSGSGVMAKSSGWLLVNPATGSAYNIIATASANCDGGARTAATSWTGVETSSVSAAHRTIYTRGDSSGSPSITISDSQSGDVVVGSIGNWGTNPVAQQTSRISQLNSFGTAYDHILESTFSVGANTTLSFSGGQLYTMGAVALVPAAPATLAIPVISSFGASPSSIISGQSSTLSWSVSGNPTPSLTLNGSPVSGSSLSVSPTQTTTYTLIATNSQGSATANTTVNVTAAPPPPAPDTAPPSTPTNLSATAVSSSQINISWTASSDNVEVTGYRIYRGATQVGTSATNSYSDTGLSASTQYSYTVSAYDAAGNNSSQSGSASATTQASAPPPSGNTVTATSCSSSAVQSAINSVSDGGTVIVPSGTCSWSSGVTLSNNKGVSLLCQSAGTCVINVGTTGQMVYMDTLSGTNTKFYRISGFKFQNAPAGSITIWLYGSGTLSNFRIDNNIFTNYGSDSIAILLGATSPVGKFFGVIDHNTFSGSNNIMGAKIFGPGDPSQWSSSVRGTSQNVFMEDNTYDFSTNTNLGSGCVDAWGAASLVFRYNDVKNCLVTAHGVTHGTVVNFEFYKNNLRRTANSGGWEDGTRLFHHQGSGEIFAWGNTFYSVGTLSDGALAITHYRSASPSVAGYSTSLGRCSGSQSIDGNRSGQLGYPCWMQPGRAPAGGSPIYGTLSPVYAWMNVDNGTGNKVSVAIENPWGATNPSVDDHVKPNRDYYDAVSNQAQTSVSSPFNGTTGMGFGILARRPTTCATNTSESGGGVGYWATDTNTLYRCSSTNTWTAHYTPYTYPHPLVSGSTPPPPPTTYTITSSAGANGNISPSGTVTVNSGSSQTFTISPNTGYSVASVTVDGANQGAVSIYTFTNVTGNHTISASFTQTSQTSTKFTAGQRVQTTSNLNVRATASATGTLLGTQSLNSLGTIVSGGTMAGGYYWWNVNYDNAPDGWSVEDYLQAYSTPIPGDLNSDGLVNSIDLSLLTSRWNTNYPAYDLNNDSTINSLDFAIMSSNWSL